MAAPRRACLVPFGLVGSGFQGRQSSLVAAADGVQASKTPMQLSVTGKQIDVGEALRQHVETTLTGIIDKYFEKAIEAHAVFSREGPLIRSDLSVHVRRDILVQGQAASADAYVAFDSAAEPIANPIRCYKRQLRGRHGHTHQAVAATLETPSARSYH